VGHSGLLAAAQPRFPRAVTIFCVIRARTGGAFAVTIAKIFVRGDIRRTDAQRPEVT
jgi:hypothetical protein